MSELVMKFIPVSFKYTKLSLEWITLPTGGVHESLQMLLNPIKTIQAQHVQLWRATIALLSLSNGLQVAIFYSLFGTQEGFLK